MEPEVLFPEITLPINELRDLKPSRSWRRRLRKKQTRALQKRLKAIGYEILNDKGTNHITNGEGEGNIIQEAADVKKRRKVSPPATLIDRVPFDGIEDAGMLSDPSPLAK